MKIWTLEVFKQHYLHEVIAEERILGGVYKSREVALKAWSETFKPEGWHDYDLTEWEV